MAVQSSNRHTVGQPFPTKLRGEPHVELDDHPNNKEPSSRNGKCNQWMGNESQEEMVGTNYHGIVRTIEVSLEYSGAGRSESRNSTSELVV